MAKRSQRLCQASWQSTLLGYRDTLLPLTRRVTPPNTASVTQKCAKFEPDSAFTVHR